MYFSQNVLFLIEVLKLFQIFMPWFPWMKEIIKLECWWWQDVLLKWPVQWCFMFMNNFWTRQVTTNRHQSEQNQEHQTLCWTDHRWLFHVMLFHRYFTFTIVTLQDSIECGRSEGEAREHKLSQWEASFYWWLWMQNSCTFMNSWMNGLSSPGKVRSGFMSSQGKIFSQTLLLNSA